MWTDLQQQQAAGDNTFTWVEALVSQYSSAELLLAEDAQEPPQPSELWWPPRPAELPPRLSNTSPGETHAAGAPALLSPPPEACCH